MKRRNKIRYSSTTDWFMPWTGLALKTGEMMIASAQVISHRTSRMAAAGTPPSERDQREFHLMGQEKIEAAAESAQAMAVGIVRLQQQMGKLAFTRMLTGTRGSRPLVTSRTVVQIVHKGLKPIHSRAVANAKRLTKLKK